MEVWDIVDINGQPTGRTHMRGNPLPEGDFHVVVEIWTVNDRNEILLTLRHPDKETFPNTWENTAGSLLAGESSRQGAVRELFEETGIIAEPEELLFAEEYTTEDALFDSYILRKNWTNDQLVMQDGETAAAQWVTLNKLNQMMQSGEIAAPIASRFPLYRQHMETFVKKNQRLLADRQYFLFDLDGTLTDSAEGILNSIAYTLTQYGIAVSDRESLRRFIGPTLRETFLSNEFNLSPAQAESAVRCYRAHYAPRSLSENKPYDGIARLLALLAEKGKTLIVATAKTTEMAVSVLKHFNLLSYFTYVVGCEPDGTRAHKAEIIAYALQQANIKELSQAVMIGDRAQDVIGAHQNGLEAIGVLYGYGGRAELAEAGADYVVRDRDTLERLLV